MKVLGSIEKIDFVKYDIHGVLARIDTGAESGALHCTKIHVETQDGKQTLFFSPFDHPEKVFKSRRFTRDIVKSSNGVGQERYFIRTKILLRGQEYSIKLSLADRTEMTFPVLIGRKFLKENKFLVDVSKESK